MASFSHRLALCLIVATLALAACKPGGGPIVLEWTTASEVNAAGFNLYRSTSLDGPYVRINPALIPAGNDPLAGGRYRYEDSATVPGQTYYYWLEEVALNGTTTRHGPVAIMAASWDQRPGLAVGLLALALGTTLFLAFRRRWRG